MPSLAAVPSGACFANRSYWCESPARTTSAWLEYRRSQNGRKLGSLPLPEENVGSPQKAPMQGCVVAARSPCNHCTCAEVALWSISEFSETQSQEPMSNE